MSAQPAAARQDASFAQSDNARMLARGAEYLPVTFPDRGAAIGFTTPKLNQARVRRNQREALELLVPNFADSDGTYVVPWNAVPDVVTLTLHDRELHRLVAQKKAWTPWDLRKLQMEIGARGLAGPTMALACRHALGEDDRLRVAANFALIQRVFGFLGFETSGLKTSNFLSVETQLHVKRAFHALGKAIGATPADCYSAIAEQSISLAQIGVPGADEPGRLRKVMGDMRSMAASLDGWGATTYSELRGKVTIIRRVIEQTLYVGDIDLDRLDARISNIANFVKNWQSEAREVQTMAGRMNWLLDGWDHIAATWFQAIATSDADAMEAVHEVMRILPRVPRNEVPEMPQFADINDKLTKDRRVREMQDWRSRSSDFELVQRIESIKGAAL